ncbi:MAG: TonB-dependent siderophore receptor [Leptolyngbya sp. SIO1E4]|nr:TonB-dependent siderophore receptor [Leptolyngbya sp. SIO1E4]
MRVSSVCVPVQLAWMVALSGSLMGVLAMSARAQELERHDVEALNPEASLTVPSDSSVLTSSPSIAGVEQPATTVTEWVTQIEASRVQITGVRIEATETGIQIVLETADGELPTPTTEMVGNALIAEIPNAMLMLPEGDSFEQFEPAAGIALVQVTNEPGDRVRVAITGTDAPPVAEATATGLTVTLGEAVADTDQDAIQIVVTGEEDEGYNPSSASTATRTDTPLRDIPQAIQVVPREVIEDQRVTRAGEALQNVSGVTDAGLFSNYLDSIFLRGFNTAQGNFFRDGVRLNSYFLGFGAEDLANLERVEVLKGPASVLYGAVETGGVINFVTKAPLSEPAYSFTASAGNYSSYRGEIDLTGPLNEQRTVLYRLNGVYDNSGSFRDFVDSERIAIAPTLSIEFGPRTSLRIDGNFSRLETLPDSGIPAIGDRPADVPRSRSIDEPFSSFEYEELTLGYTLNHEFNDNWSFRNIVRYQSFRVPEFIGPLDLSLDEATGELERFPYSQRVNADSYSAQTDFIGEFTTGSIQHRLLLGADFNYTRQDRRFTLDTTVLYPSINIFNPVYANQRYDTPTTLFRDDKFYSYGFYIQDQITLSPQWQLLIGGRYDIFDQERTFGDVEPRERIFEQTDSKFTPRLGVVYQPSDTVSLYASYANSFLPSGANQRNPDGSEFEPTTGTQYEIGIKADFLEGRLSATLAGFILERQNVATEDPNNPGFSITTGEQTSQGIELDIAGEILPGWNIIASATYLDARVTEDNTIPEGNRLTNAAETSASLWTTYRIQSGDLEGLGFGLGLYYVGDREGDLANSFTLPSYVRTDAALYYERDNWQAALNIRNLFDVKYFLGSTGSRTGGINFGEPLTVVGSFSIEF